MREHNYNNLHLAGTHEEIRDMVHRGKPLRHNFLGNLIGGFIALAIGATILPEIMRTLRKEGLL